LTVCRRYATVFVDLLYQKNTNRKEKQMKMTQGGFLVREIITAFLILGLLLIFAFLLVLQASKIYTLPEEKVDGVVRVLMHEPDRYTLMIQRANSKEIRLRQVFLNGSVPQFTLDVPTEQSAWALIKSYKMGGKEFSTMEIHIHSPQSVLGAGWDNGKNGRGQTQVIE